MATVDLEYKTRVRLDLDQLKSDLTQASQVIDSKLVSASGTAGVKGGKALASGFTSQLSTINSAITSLLGGISFNTIVQGSLQAFNSFSTLQRGQLALNSAIGAFNSINQQRVATLNNSTNSTLKQAEALGINTDKLYKTVAGVKQAGDATKGYRLQIQQLERQIANQERAVKIQTRTIEENIRSYEKEKNINDDLITGIRNKIDLLKEETEERIRQYKVISGFNDLINANDLINLEIKKLQVKKYQNEEDNKTYLATDNQNRLVDKQINKLEKKKLINEIALAPLEREIEKLKNINDQQIKNEEDKLTVALKTNRAIEDNLTRLRDQVQNLNLQLDIDTNPARIKIEDLRNIIEDINISQTGSSGGFDDKKIIDPKTENQLKKRIGFIKDNLLQQIDPKEVKDKLQELVRKSSGLVNEGALSQAFSTLTSSGAGADQALKLLENYIVATSKSSVGSKDLGQGVQNLADSFQSGLSALGNYNGLQENYDSVIIPKGIKALQDLYKEQGILTDGQELNYDTLSQQEQAYVKSIGTQKVLAARLGDSDTAWQDFNKTVDSGALELARLNAEIEITKQEFGEALAPVIIEVTRALLPFIDIIGDFAKANPALTQTIITLTASLLGLITVFGFLGTAISGVASLVVSPIFIPLITTIGIITGTVVGLINTVLLLKTGWESNFLGIQTITESVMNFIGDKFNSLMNFVRPFNDTLLYIANVGFVILGKAGSFYISKIIENFNWLSNVLSDFLKPLRDQFSNLYNFVKPILDVISLAIGSVFKGAINKIIDFFNSGIKAINNLIKKIPEIPGITKPQPIPEIATFAKGGYVTKPTFGLFGEAGDEALLNKVGIKNLGLTPQLVNLLNSKNLSNTPSNNINGSYNNQNTTIQIFGNSDINNFRPALGF